MTEPSLDEDLDMFTYEEWVRYGVDNGWVGSPRCIHHDGMDTTEDEESEMEEGHDPCIVMMRVWDS